MSPFYLRNGREPDLPIDLPALKSQEKEIKLSAYCDYINEWKSVKVTDFIC